MIGSLAPPTDRDCQQFIGRQVVRRFPPIRDWQDVEWPESIRPLVDRYGPQRVWDAGFAVHDFPPTWCRGSGEALAITKHLEEEQKEQDHGDYR